MKSAERAETIPSELAVRGEFAETFILWCTIQFDNTFLFMTTKTRYPTHWPSSTVLGDLAEKNAGQALLTRDVRVTLLKWHLKF